MTGTAVRNAYNCYDWNWFYHPIGGESEMKKTTKSCAWLLWAALFTATAASVAQETSSTQAALEGTTATADVTKAEGFPPEQIEQLLAPIALYPDALLAQILMASTYPLDIVQASRWTKDHSNLEGEALEQAAAQESWDPSVQALVFFPSVLDKMNSNLDWTQDLGEAYLGQEDEVIAAVQRLRKEAHEAGNLESNDKQQVVVEGDTIIVQPAQPEVVYVPSYNPTVVYAQPAPTTTYYPTVYQSSSSSDSGVSFLTGALVGGLLTAAIMWDRNDNWCCGVYYGGPGRWGGPGYWGRPGYWGGGWRRPVHYGDINIKTGDITINKGNRVGKWEHRPEHRGNINYKNKRTKAKYSKDLPTRPINRDAARGYKRDAKPGTRDIAKPGTRDIAKPGTRDIKRPEKSKDFSGAKRPEKRDAKQVQRRDANIKRPEKSQTAKPQTRDIKKPQSKPVTRQAQPQKRGGDAFKKSDGRMDRAASNRGQKSVNRSGKAANRGGGGGGKARLSR